MLSIITDQVFTIGLVAAVPQPVVVDKALRNVPQKGVYNWEPGAHFGIYRPDTFWFESP
jgi:peptide/nickel transport system substrate-binding protein